MSIVQNKLPNVEDLVLLNSTLEELEKLKKLITDTTEEKFSLTQKQKIEAKEFVYKAEIDAKKQLTLEYIEEQLDKLRNQEKELAKKIDIIFEKSIQNYLDNGKFKNFLEKIVQKLNRKKVDFVILVGKNASKYLPDGTNYEESKEDNTLQIETSEKVYIFDLDQLKVDLKQNLLREKLPEYSL